MNPEELKIVLTELLEEMQKTNNHLASQHTELQEIKEKISITENGILNAGSLAERLGAIHLTCQNVARQVTFPGEEMRQLKRSLDIPAEQLLKPVQQVKHFITYTKD